MEAYDIQSRCQIKRRQEGALAVVELRSRERRVCGIAFEEYLDIWMKIATTNQEHLMGSQPLGELSNYTERWAVHYGSTDDLAKAQHNVPDQKERQRKDTKAKETRVARMRRLYMQTKAPDLRISDPDERENWEREMDELVEWTHSLSLKELDKL